MSDTAKRATGVEAARAELLHRRADFARGLTEKNDDLRPWRRCYLILGNLP